MAFLQTAISAINTATTLMGKQDWTITDENGKPILPIYSVNGIPSITAGGEAVSAPVEENSFQSYNKTTAPIAIQIEIVFQGTNSELQNALTKTLELKNSTRLFSIVTPYYEFQSMTLASFDYSQTTTDGQGSVVVKMNCQEVKEVAAAYATVSQDAIQANQQAASTAASGGGSGGSSISEADAADPSDVSTVDTGQTAPDQPTSSEEETAEPKRQSILKQMEEEGW